MKYSLLPPELEEKVRHTLFIDTFSSECGNCGKGTLPEAKTHKEISGYNGGQDGCGIEWKFVSTNYVGRPDLYDNIRAMRPDLEFWLIWEEDEEGLES